MQQRQRETATMEAPYQFRLFGVPALLDPNGLEVPLRTRKQAALLLYLTLEGQSRPVHRDRLAELLWPNVSAARGRHSLSQAMTELRERLTSDLFSRGGNVLRLEQRITTELDAIAQGVVPGLPLEPLVGVDSWSGAEFAHWADAARERIVRSVGDVLHEFIRDRRRAGHLQDACSAAGALYALDPFSELAVQTLAERALVKGDSVYAIHLLRRHVTKVSEELQCDPQPSVTRLLKRLEMGEADLHEKGRPTRSQVSTVCEPDFVGRHRELATLEGDWEEAQAGTLRACLMTGAGGIGKSALLRRFSTSLIARGAPVFQIFCQEIGGGIPFSVAADLIGALARDPGIGATDPLLLSEVTRIVPSLRVRYRGIPQPDPIAPEAIRIRLSEALFHIVECIGDGSSLAIAIDDIQHIDPASRDLLFLLQRRLAGSPVLLLAALRSPTSRANDQNPVEGFSWHSRVLLEPLDRAEAADLVMRLCADSSSPPPLIASKIVELSGGNPYFIELLVADWHSHTQSSVAEVALQATPPQDDWQPPRDLRVAFARQFERMSENARSVLHALATARRQLTAEQLTAVTGCARTEIEKALLGLSTAGLTHPLRDGAAFKNDLHRAYVYYSMDATVRQWYHARLASQLAMAEVAEHGLEIEIGTHHLEAGQRTSAAARIISGAREAIAVGAYGEAEAVLQRLLPALSTAEDAFAKALALLGESLRGQGKYRDLLQLFDDHQDMFDKRDAIPRVLVLRAEALQRNHERGDSEISEVASQALELARESGDLQLYLRALQIAAESVSETASVAGLRSMEREASDLARNIQTPEVRARALMTTGFCQFSIHACEDAATSFRESAVHFSGPGFENERMRVLNGLGNALLPTGRLAEAVKALAEALTIAVRVEDYAHCATVLGNLGAVYEWMALFDDAAVWYSVARVMASRCDVPRKIVEAYLNSFDLSLLTGNFKEAGSLLDVALRAAQMSRSARLNARALLASADMRIAMGEPEFAWPLVAEAAGMTGPYGWVLDNSGRYDRLIEHFEHATGQHLVSERSPGRTAICEIEVRALQEQLGTCRNPRDRGVALRMAASLGLYGVIGRLAAVRIYAGPEPEAHPITGLRYVRQVFPQSHVPAHGIASANSLLDNVGLKHEAANPPPVGSQTSELLASFSRQRQTRHQA